MKYFALAMVAVLAMASVSMAAMTVSVGPAVDLDDPNDILVSYTVTTTATTGWQDLRIMDAEGTALAPVHQMNRYSSGTVRQSCWDAVIQDYDAEDQAALPFDTHILIPLDNAFAAGSTGTGAETNLNDNPGGINMDVFSMITRAGMGTFTTQGAGFYVQTATPAASYDVLQVVLPKGALVYLYGHLADGTVEGEIMRDGSVGLTGVQGIPIGVPEPGTIVMFVAGALCLLGIRRK